MKKQIITRIISGVIISTFVFSFLQIVLPTQTNAASQIDWENPNKNGKNTYKFKITDVVNSDVAMQVVGCTGVVSKVSNWMLKLVQSDKLKDKAWDKLRESAIKQCRAGEKIAINSAGTIINVNDMTSGVDVMFDCGEIIKTEDGKALREQTAQRAETARKDNLEQCFNGIAITLAKNQLTAITRNAVSWVNSGFNGNPLYVQNITSLTNGIERNVLETGINQLTNQNSAYPYGTAFSQSVIRGYQSGGIFNSGGNALDNLTSDLSAFITDPNSYFTVKDERTALQRAKDINIAFSDDFSTGGWDGWLAFTQRDQNNPLGFTMRASQYFADDIDEQTNNTKAEVLQNNGFLSQKRCIKWQIYDDTGNPKISQKYINWQKDSLNSSLMGPVSSRPEMFVFATNKTKSGYDVCKEWDVVTPGSLIKDQMSTYINSPVRQLELADTINKSLNAVFSILISKLQSNGLSGLSSEQYVYDDPNMNWTDTTNGSLGGTTYNNNGAYTSGFDLTRDLGNTYIYDKPTKLGTWNANDKINMTNTNKSLYPDLAPINYTGENDSINQNSSNVYYTVSNPGKTKIIMNGYNGWALGDRAFWDGSKWQNWKCYKSTTVNKTGPCDNQANPIKKRGVIQIQKDYIVAAKESLQFLPNVMPKLGELDYCIPGPNPNYKANVSENENLYTSWVGTLSGTYNKNGLLERDSTKFHIAQPGDKEYEDWKDIFKDDLGVWNYLVKNPEHFYYWWPSMLGDGTEVKKDTTETKLTKWIDNYLYMVNNYMFNNFYEVFDKIMNKTYFANMTKEYLETENSTTKTPNPSYIPMAEEGLNLTKDIVAYNEDITTVMNQYRSDIAQANTNIGKLETIKKQVSIIIKDAQDRRNAKLIEQVNKLNSIAIENCKAAQVECDNSTENVAQCLVEYKQCLADAGTNGSILTPTEYKDKYAECLDEEDIIYYDESDIMNDSIGERCNNNLDDDLDGLIDSRDPDCSGGEITPPGDLKHCVMGQYTTNLLNSPANKACKDRKTSAECTNSDYYYGELANVCDWTTGPGITPPLVSLHGCTIKTSASKPSPSAPNQHCLLRTETECTVNDYIDENHKSYKCEFKPI